MIFVDTSVFIALLNPNDINHKKAKEKWKEAVESGEFFLCTNYILLEASSLIQRRFGIKALRSFQEFIVPILNIEWINEDFHNKALSSLFTANRRGLSLVDCTSFEIMRAKGIKKVFTFDKHFKEQGFLCI